MPPIRVESLIIDEASVLGRRYRCRPPGEVDGLPFSYDTEFDRPLLGLTARPVVAPARMFTMLEYGLPFSLIGDCAGVGVRSLLLGSVREILGTFAGSCSVVIVLLSHPHYLICH